MTDSIVRYLSCAETAKFVRAALASEFPSVRFSVRSKTYSGGASISVRWVDGPLERDVEAVAGQYAGSDIDTANGYVVLAKADGR